MDVSFEKIKRLGTECYRFIPILTEETWSPEIRELYTVLDDSRRDLALVNTDDFWNIYLEFYELTQMVESFDGATIHFYHLKPGVSFDLPSKLGLIHAIPTSNVIFDETATVFESKPLPGRMLEFLLLDGSFQFNKGSVFDAYWSTYTL